MDGIRNGNRIKIEFNPPAGLARINEICSFSLSTGAVGIDPSRTGARRERLGG